MELYFKLSISYRDFLPYYQGLADKVEVRETQGRILWINGRHFRRFLTENGIQGYILRGCVGKQLLGFSWVSKCQFLLGIY